MLVAIVGDRIIAPQLVCQSCLLADRDGQPRWRAGQLCCGRTVRTDEPQPSCTYECQMGFRLVEIEG